MFLDYKKPIAVQTGGYLPHWHQEGCIQFVTFRLADSLPREKCEDLINELTRFNEKYPKPWNEDIKSKYRTIIGPLEERLLDNGYGSSVFRDECNRKILRESIMHYDTIKYEILAYVIMPNHVHLLIQPLNDETIGKIVGAIKSFTAIRINRNLNHSGNFWQKESFDRMVRNINELRDYVEYIRQNPNGLSPDMYELYLCPALTENIF